MNIARFLRRYHVPLMLLLSVFAPLMLMFGRPQPEITARLMLFPAAYAMLAALLICVPGRARMPLLAAGCVLVIGAGRLLFPDRLSVLSIPVSGAAALFFSLPYADKSPAELSPFFYLATLVSQFATLFLLHFSADQKAACDALYLPLQSGFVLYLFLLLLAFSRISLNNATLSRYRIPGVIARVCTVLTVCFFGLALALASLPAVISGVYAAFHMLRRGISQLLLLLANLLPVESPGGLAGSAMPLPPEFLGVTDQPPSLLSIILEKAAILITAIVLIAGSLILVRLLMRLLVRLVRRLLESLQRHAAAAAEDYEDEITDTRLGETDRSLILRRRRARSLEYPDTPAGRIRSGYARLLRAHGEWGPASTARENLPGAAAALYERARYSAHPVSARDAELFDQEIRRL